MKLEELASMLLKAEKECKPLEEPITKLKSDLNLDEAYKIQLMIRDEMLKCGYKVVGKKIGFTSKGMQNLLGITQPDYGHLFDNMIIPQGTPCDTAGLISPKVEGEIAFILKKDLTGPGVTVSDVHQATEGVMASIEIVDSRIMNWNIKFEDSVADNASSSRFILGSKIMSLKELDLRSLGMFIEKNGELMNSGAGVEVLGNPAYSVAWLANKLSEFGIGLKAGEIILSGAITAATSVEKGDIISVSFDKLGELQVKFV